MTAGTPTVFVSYAHDSPTHQAEVLAFASFLRTQGIDATIDLWHSDQRRDWVAWATRQMTEADYVIVIASPMYRRSGDGLGADHQHRGVQSESAVLRDLVHADRTRWLRKILPVLLPGRGVDEIPLFLQPHTASRYPVSANTVEGADELLRVILGKPGHVPPEVAPNQPDLPPRQTVPGAANRTAEPATYVNNLTGTVGGSGIVIQAGRVDNIHNH